MDSDDYGDDMDDTAFLDAATQAERDRSSPFRSSPRPVKRRRVHDSNEGPAPAIPPRKQRRQRPFLDDSESDNYAPTNPRESSSHDHGHGHLSAAAASRSTKSAQKRKRRASLADSDQSEEDETPKKQTVAEQRKNRIHVPTADLDLSDAFFTQPPQEPSPPWKPRGAIWHKPTTTIGINRPPRLDTAASPVLPIRTAVLPPDNTTTALPITTASPLEYDPRKELEDLPSDAFSSSPSSPVLVVSERRTNIVAPQTGLRQTTLFGRESVSVAPSQVNKRYNYVVDRQEEPPTHHKLNPEALKTWVYPTNLGTIRDYQFNIVRTGLFHNALVALPTGLGKTFIAATIMLNWFRWTTEAQIVFVAPTKPLVAQQVDACFHTVGIPRSETTMLTGGVQTGLRAEEWAKRRVFFMTPQTLLNDLKSGYADPKKIVLLVVDEAHRATGSYAYVEVVSFLRRFNNSFRILALTATPGADIESIQKVIDGLDISKVEIRTENSIDLRGFVHRRKVDKKVFDNTDELEMCLELFEKAVNPVFKKVSGLHVLYSESARDLTPYGCMKGRQKWMLEQGRGANQGYKAMINSIFTVLGSISQGLELLKFHGIGPFYVKMKEFKNEKSNSKYKKEILDSDHFKTLMNRLEAWTSGENFIGHPKLEHLQQVVIDHFVTSADSGPQGGAEANQTRIMVFAHFRDSAEEIVRVLKKHEPMIKPHVFVGQQNSKNSDGMDQKTQLAVIEKFKAGTYNTLVATSIGEEGLDIGEVDLIICYDSKASPIRMLQRMGRTGRKREGKIILLQMKGKEENDAIKAKDNYERMQKEIASGDKFAFHEARRILPRDVQPVAEKRPVEIPLENSQQNWLPEPNKRGRAPKKPPKKFHMPDNVITGFVTAGRMDEEIAPKPRKKTVVKPSEQVCEIPPLESVLLDDEAIRDLERRYQTVYDDDDAPMVGALDLSKHPQRVLGKTLLLSSGRVTQNFVAMMHRMHDMNDDRLDDWRRRFQDSDIEDSYEGVVVSDHEQVEQVIEDEDVMWADDDPPSQPLSKFKSKSGPKPGSKAMTQSKAAPAPFIEEDAIWADDDPPSQPLSKAKSKPKSKAKAVPKAAAPKPAAPHGRARKETSTITPVRKAKSPPKTKTPNWRMSNSAEEGASSSPPPTDPQMRFGSQAETIGSDDTIDADNNPQDTQAYRLDSDLVSFIAEDEDEIEQLESSSLPGMSFKNGVGHGTQALVKAAKPKRAKKSAKIFSSDTSDNDAVVSSDSDDEDVGPVVRVDAKGSRAMAFVVDSESELESETDVEEAAIPRVKRVRRVVEDDEDDE